MIFDLLLSSMLVSGGGHTFGNEAGNGGDVVICPNGQAAPIVTVLDYFEARKMMPQLPLDLVGQDAAELVERALHRLDRLDHARADRFRAYAEEITNGDSSYFFSGVILRDITDSGYVPTGECKIRQAVIQKEPWHPLDRRYTFDQDVWDDLSVADRAGLILHEAIYREVLLLGQRNSSAVRQLVAWLSSPLFDQVTPEQYTDIESAIFFVPKLLAFNQERVTLYAERGAKTTFSMVPFLAHSEASELHWRLDERSPVELSIAADSGELSVSVRPDGGGTLRSSITVSSGILWDVVPVDVVAILPQQYPPRWLADEFEVPMRRGETKKNFKLSTLVGAENRSNLKFRMISGPRGVVLTSDGDLLIESTFEGRSKVEVTAYNDSGWAQTSFVVGRE